VVEKEKGNNQPEVQQVAGSGQHKVKVAANKKKVNNQLEL